MSTACNKYLPYLDESGKRFVGDSLSDDSSISEAVTHIQEKCGLATPFCEPALDFLDALEISRSNVYFTMFEKLKIDLMNKVSTASKEDLSKLLFSCIRFIKISQLKPIVIAIINKLGELPMNHLQAIVRGQLLDDMPPTIRKQAWEIAPKLFVDWMKKMSGICSLSDSNYLKTYVRSICEVVLGSEKLCRFMSQFYLDYARSMSSMTTESASVRDLAITGSMFYRDIICFLGTPASAGSLSSDGISISQRTIPQFSMLSTIALTIRAIITRKYVLMGKASVQQKFGVAGDDAQINECKVLYNAFKSLISSQLGAVNHAILQREALIRSLSSSVDRAAAESNKRKREDVITELPAKGKVGGAAPVITILPVAQWPVVVPPGATPTISDAFLRKLLNEMANSLTKLDKQQLFSEPVTEAVAPDYFSVIKSPMDISTIKRKIAFGSYASLTEFEEDIFLMVNNAVLYNKPGDFVYNEATDLYKQWLKMRKKFHLRYAAGDTPTPAKALTAVTAVVVASPATAQAAEEEEEEEEDPILPVTKWPSVASIAGAEMNLQGVPKDKVLHIFQDMAKAIIKMDTNKWFLVPVTEDVAPDYFSVISKPMDIESIRRKISRHMYKSLAALEADFYLMFHNATVYNPPGDEVYEYAVTLYEKWLEERKPFIKSLVALNPVPVAAPISSSAAAPAVTSASSVVAAAPVADATGPEPMDMTMPEPVPVAAPAPVSVPVAVVSTTMLPVSKWPSPESITGDAINLEGVPRGKVSAIYQDMMRAFMKIDYLNTFLAPVTEAVAPGYFSVIAKPMDIGSIQRKINRNMYKTLTALEEDIYLMLHNATVYNKPGDMCYNEAMAIYDRWLVERNSFIQKLVDLAPKSGPVTVSTESKAAADAGVTPIPALDPTVPTVTATSSSAPTVITSVLSPVPVLEVQKGSPLILPVSRWPYLNSIDGSVVNSDCLSTDQLLVVYHSALKTLTKLDTNEWFIPPVTDAIAPGYSTLIAKPMCISDMQSKVATGAYKSFTELEEDIYLMLHNATVYNKPGNFVHEEAVTIYKKWMTNRKHSLKKIVQLCLAAKGGSASVDAKNNTNSKDTEASSSSSSALTTTSVDASVPKPSISSPVPVPAPAPAPAPAAASDVVVKKESADGNEAESAGDSSVPVVATRAATGDGKLVTAAVPVDKRAEQMEILQKEKKLLVSLRAASSALSAMDAHSAHAMKASLGGGLSFLGHHAPVAAAASVVDELPECLTDSVLKNALLLCSNTLALREIWCKACVQSIVATSLAPVVKTLNAVVATNSTINTSLPLMPVDHAETRFLFQMFQISMLGSSVRDYDQIPSIDGVVFRLFVPHMLRQLLQFIITQQHSKSAARMTAADAQDLVLEWKYLGYVESTEKLAHMEPSLNMLGRYLVEYGMKLIKA